MAARMALYLALWALGWGALASGEDRIHSAASDDLRIEGPVQQTRQLLGMAEDKKLFSGASKGFIKLVNQSLEEGANIDVKLFKLERTALLAAINANRSSVVTLLINAGADLEIADKNDETPLLVAIFANDVALVKELLAAGASPNGDPSLDLPRKGSALEMANQTAEEATTGGQGSKKKPAGPGKGPGTDQNEEATTGGQGRKKKPAGPGKGPGTDQNEEAATGGQGRKKKPAGSGKGFGTDQNEEAATGGQGRKKKPAGPEKGPGTDQNEEAATGGHRHKKKPAGPGKGPGTDQKAAVAPTAEAKDEAAEAKGAEGHKKHRKKSRGLLQAGTDSVVFSIGGDFATAPAATPVDRVDSTIDPFAAAVDPTVDPAADPAVTANASSLAANASDAGSVESTTQRNHTGQMGRNESDGGARLTPLILASAGGNPEIVQLLLDYGAVPDLGDDLGDTALHKASLMVGKGSEQIATMLLEADVDVDARGFRGRTPLFSASEFGNLPVLKILLKAGADPSIVDLNNQTATDVICDCASLEQFNLCPDGRCERKPLLKYIANSLRQARAPQAGA